MPAILREGSSDTTLPIRLGANYDGDENFPGLMDEVALYNIALDPTRVTAHKDAGMP